MKIGFQIAILVTVFGCCTGQVVEKCRTDAFPPPDSTKLATVVVNLDDPPALRWKAAIEPVKDDINALIGIITGMLVCMFPTISLQFPCIFFRSSLLA